MSQQQPRTEECRAYPFIVFACALLFWFSLLVLSGSLFSGYHFTDDHQILSINADLIASPDNFFRIVQRWLINDLGIRFRPFYFIHRLLVTKFLGINFNLWSIYTGLLAVFATLFLYLFAKKIGFCLIESFVFVFLILMGRQSAIWWRLGPNETVGSLLMSLSLYSLGLTVYSDRRKPLHEVLFVICIVLMSLCKESFVLLIPAFLYWKVWLYKDKNQTSWIISAKNCLLTILVLLIVVVSEIYFIKSRVGTNQLGYAGIQGFHPLQYIKTGIYLPDAGGVGLISFFGVLFIILSGRYFWRDGLKLFICDFLPIAVLLILIVGPQAILYAKSGIDERYLIPAIMGYSIFIAHLMRMMRLEKIEFGALNGWIQNPAKKGLVSGATGIVVLGITLMVLPHVERFVRLLVASVTDEPFSRGLIPNLKPLVIFAILTSTAVVASRRSKKFGITRPVYVIQSVLAVAFVCVTGIAYVDASHFAEEGKATKAFLTAIQDNTEESSLILVVAEPARNYEWGFSIKMYLTYLGERRNLYVYPISAKSNYEEFEERLAKEFAEFYGDKSFDKITDTSRIECVAIFPGMESLFLSHSQIWFDASWHKRIDSAGFAVYHRDRQ